MATDIPFVREMAFDYGVVQQVSPLIRRVIAANPSAFTFHGTGTYIVGHGKVVIIDPGPDLPEHVEALLAALRGEQVSHLLITHTHRDHSPAAKHLKGATGAPTYGFGPHGSGRPGGADEVEEGADRDFAPDVVLGDGDVVEADGLTFEALHTPGHTSNHLCFALAQEKALFSGDHVMGWSTSVISPPDGDMRAYMGSLRRLLPRDDAVYWPTHGPPITAPKPFVEACIAHREERERQIVACIEGGRRTIPEMVEVIYAEVPKHLHRAAGRSVLAHLLYMVESERVRCDGPPGPEARYALGPDDG
jgi:glyoxylase-like metal-dependent hydrolase (beta-lactamase superfamily II)